MKWLKQLFCEHTNEKVIAKVFGAGCFQSYFHGLPPPTHRPFHTDYTLAAWKLHKCPDCDKQWEQRVYDSQFVIREAWLHEIEKLVSLGYQDYNAYRLA